MNKNEIYTAFFIAKKNIIKNKSTLLFTILIISLGFISSTIIYGALQDTSYDIEQNDIETTRGHIILEPYKDKKYIENPEQIIKKIKTLPEIQGIAAISKKNLRIYDKKENFVDVEIYIVDPTDFADISIVNEIINEGRWLSKGHKDKIVLGCIHIKDCNEIIGFDRIDITPGEKVRVIDSTGKESILILEGIYDHIFIQVELQGYISKETAKEMFPDYNFSRADEIIIALSTREQANKIKQDLSKMNLQLEIFTWEEKATRYSSIIDSFLVIADLSFLIGIIVSGISIYVVLYINILNKKTQIGIIKAMGIKAEIISLSYIFLAFFLGVIGSISGILLTYLMIEYFTINPLITGVGELVPRITKSLLLLVSTTIILASVITGYIVSKRITKQNIIQAIYHG